MSPDQKLDHITQLLEGLTQTMTRQFDDVHTEFNTVRKELDEIKFLATGQERRISILEDRIRQLATKVGMEFM